MATRILIIHSQLSFAVQLKQSLERSGQFDVHPFTSVQAGIDYARTHEQDLALVDFSFIGSEIVQRLRDYQPGLAVIASPRQSETASRALFLQGSVNTPISARELLPIINSALDDMVPQPQYILPPETPFGTHLLPTADESEQQPTSSRIPSHKEEPPPPSTQFATRLFPDDPGDEMPEYRFDTPTDPPDGVAFGTQLLSTPANDLPLDQTYSADPVDAQFEFFGTLESDEASPGRSPRDPYGTQVFDQDGPPEPQQYIDTAALFADLTASDEEPPPEVKPLRPLSTRILQPKQPPPSELPEFSTLDDVVGNSTNIFEPPFNEGDTPPVPETNSDALRQFLATSQGDDQTFNDILDAVGQSSPQSEAREGDPFDDLVNSLRIDKPQTALPARQQQAFEFILQSMDFEQVAEDERAEPANAIDSVLQEIRRPKTSQLTNPEDLASFAKLSAEEPPMPTIEESGTIGDLLTGVNDMGFRNVLAMLRGEDPSELADSERSRPTARPEDIRKTHPEFYGSETGPQKLDVEAEDPRQIASILPSDFVFDEPSNDDKGKTAAQVILETALDPETASRPFSIESLLADIDRQLPQYRPNVQPLPSWKTNWPDNQHNEVSKRKPRLKDQRGEDSRYVKEPDFLPEELPPPPPILPENDFGDLTTRPSQNQGTAPDPRFTETAPQKPIRRLSAKQQTPEPPQPDELPELPPARSQPVAQGEHFDIFGQLDENESFDEFEKVDTDEQAEEATWIEPAARLEQFEQAALVEQADKFEPYERFEQEPDEVTWVEPATQPEQPEPVAQFEQFDFSFDEILDENEEQAVLEDDQYTQPTSVEQPARFEQFEFEQYDLEVFDNYDEDASTVLLNPAEIRQLQEAFATAPEGQSAPVIPPSAEESRIAQLALSLTQASMELTTEATLLTHNGEIIARSGSLTDEDFDDLNRMVGGTWDATSGKSHIRFITLPGSGQDYMLYSCKTDDDLTLSLIFGGKTPLRVIRSQGKKLVKAITAVPELPPVALPEELPLSEASVELEPAVEIVVAPPEPVNIGPLTPYAFFWLLRDSDIHIEDHTAQKLYGILDDQLTGRHWRIDRLEVRADSVYLVAGVPGDSPARDLVRDLKALSAQIADRDPSIWAESYLVVSPGRELDEDEIREFIEFERSA